MQINADIPMPFYVHLQFSPILATLEAGLTDNAVLSVIETFILIKCTNEIINAPCTGNISVDLDLCGVTGAFTVL